MSNTYIFVVGLHKSGTSMLASVIGQHPDISAFNDTGFPKDEGQFLQTVFPIAHTYGGPGKFGFSDEMHLTEHSSLLTNENKKKLYNEWHKYWDNDKGIFLEKSPPNILKTRFLQAVFPGAYFLIITRHPIAVSYSTQTWSKTSILDLLDHWVRCHEILKGDIAFIENNMLIRYEDFVLKPEFWKKKIFEWLATEYSKYESPLEQDTNNKYYSMWENEVKKNSQILCPSNIRIMDIDKRIQEYGYSLFNGYC